jgi:hypothetical protein
MPTEGRRKAQAKYNAKPEQKKRRAMRNKARRMLERKGLVRKGDGKDIDHKDHNPRNNKMSNLAVMKASVNRRDGGPGALKKKKRKK